MVLKDYDNKVVLNRQTTDIERVSRQVNKEEKNLGNQKQLKTVFE